MSDFGLIDTGESKDGESRWLRFTLDTVGQAPWPTDSQGRPIYPTGFEELAHDHKTVTRVTANKCLQRPSFEGAPTHRVKTLPRSCVRNCRQGEIRPSNHR